MWNGTTTIMKLFRILGYWRSHYCYFQYTWILYAHLSFCNFHAFKIFPNFKMVFNMTLHKIQCVLRFFDNYSIQNISHRLIIFKTCWLLLFTTGNTYPLKERCIHLKKKAKRKTKHKNLTLAVCTCTIQVPSGQNIKIHTR